MTQQRLETVKVQDGKGGYRVINKKDFKEGEDQIYNEPKSAGKKGEQQSSSEKEDFNALTVADLQQRLDKVQIPYDSRAHKDDLVKLAEKNRDKLSK
jgi:hypothetical protein